MKKNIDYGELYKTVRHIVSGYDMPYDNKEDVVQNIVIKIVDDCASQWRKEGRWQNFVAIITRNAVRDFFNKRKQEAKAMAEYTRKHMLEHSQLDYYDKAIRRYQNNYNRLSKQQKKIVDLACDGCGSKEIADELDTTQGTVWVQLHRARKKMAKE